MPSMFYKHQDEDCVYVEFGHGDIVIAGDDVNMQVGLFNVFPGEIGRDTTNEVDIAEYGPPQVQIKFKKKESLDILLDILKHIREKFDE